MTGLRVALFLSCIVAAFAQIPTPLASVITLDGNGTVYSGVIPMNNNSFDAQRYTDYYRIWIPENADYVTFQYETDPEDTTDCNYLYWQFSTTSYPCGIDWSESGLTFPCRNNHYTSSDGTLTLYAESSYSEQSFTVGGYIYVGVTKYYGSDYDITCPYVLNATVYTCPEGQTAVYDSSTGTNTVCVPYVNVTLPYAVAIANETNEYSLTKVWVPANSGSVKIHINATDSCYAYGNTDYPSRSGDYQCYDSSSSMGDYYIIDLDCYAIQSGWFFITIENSGISAEGYAYTMDVTTVVCPEGWGGWNCTYRSTSYNATTDVGNFTLGDIPAWTNPFDYYFMDINATTGSLNFTATEIAGDGYIYFRRNGYPEDDSDYYISSANYISMSNTPVAVSLLPEDLAIGGRLYFGIENSGSGELNYTLSPISVDTSSSSSSASTSGSATTMTATSTSGSATTVTGTTSGSATTVTATSTSGSATTVTGTSSSTTSEPATTTGSASSVVASFAMIVALIALVF